MNRVGLLVGRETSFPEALIAEINRRGRDVTAEYVKIGTTPMNGFCQYDLIIDRISHEVPVFQSYLKNAYLQGTVVINNPFWRLADDKFLGTSLAHDLGVAVPKTVMLPNKDYIPGVVEESLRNLLYPLDWDSIIGYVGLPAVLKPVWGGGWRDVFVVRSRQELLDRYNGIGLQTMILQEFIEWQQYVRALVIGGGDVLPVLWDPTLDHFDRYKSEQAPLPSRLREQCEREALLLTNALGYDMNTVEFAIRDGVPCAIDFMNSAPDFDITSLGNAYFNWVVDKMADHAIRVAHEGRHEPPLRWQGLFNRDAIGRDSTPKAE